MRRFAGPIACPPSLKFFRSTAKDPRGRNTSRCGINCTTLMIDCFRGGGNATTRSPRAYLRSLGYAVNTCETGKLPSHRRRGVHWVCIRSLALVSGGIGVIGVDNFDPFYPRVAKLSNLDRIGAEVEARPSPGFTLIEVDIRDNLQMVRSSSSRHKPIALFSIARWPGRGRALRPGRYTSVNLDGTVSVLKRPAASTAVTSSSPQARACMATTPRPRSPRMTRWMHRSARTPPPSVPVS